MASYGGKTGGSTKERKGGYRGTGGSVSGGQTGAKPGASGPKARGDLSRALAGGKPATTNPNAGPSTSTAIGPAKGGGLAPGTKGDLSAGTMGATIGGGIGGALLGPLGGLAGTGLGMLADQAFSGPTNPNQRPSNAESSLSAGREGRREQAARVSGRAPNQPVAAVRAGRPAAMAMPAILRNFLSGGMTPLQLRTGVATHGTQGGLGSDRDAASYYRNLLERAFTTDAGEYLPLDDPYAGLLPVENQYLSQILGLQYQPNNTKSLLEALAAF